MSVYRHIPVPPLSEYIDFFWYYVDLSVGHAREHVLPDATFELIFNLQDTPRKLFDRGDIERHESFKRGWISGAHSKYLVIDALDRSSMIGVHFKPGGAASFLGLPAGELSEKVVELDALWGTAIWDWRDQLLAARTPAAKFTLIEQLLTQRLAASAGNNGHHKALSWVVSQYVAEPHLRTIGSVSDQLGFSHKHFIELFRRETGLTPKLFCRIRRFQQVLAEIQTRKTVDWADVACGCGYFDQSHFVHDFLNFSGMNPSVYLRRRMKEEVNFVPVDEAE